MTSDGGTGRLDDAATFPASPLLRVPASPVNCGSGSKTAGATLPGERRSKLDSVNRYSINCWLPLANCGLATTSTSSVACRSDLLRVSAALTTSADFADAAEMTYTLPRSSTDRKSTRLNSSHR